MLVRKRPIEVEAIRFDGANLEQIQKWASRDGAHDMAKDWSITGGQLAITEAQGQTFVPEGSWIVWERGWWRVYRPNDFEGAHYFDRDADMKRWGLDRLGPSELEVVMLIAEGLDTREIAARLDRSVKTVEWHRAAIGRKLGITNKVQIALIALAAGIAELPRTMPTRKKKAKVRA